MIHFSWFIAKFAARTHHTELGMDHTAKDKVFFIDSVDDCNVASLLEDVVHILCTEGCMSFTFRETRYNIAVGDYVILTHMSFASGFVRSENFKGIFMCFPESYVASMALRSNYGITGHLSLLQDPIMKLSRKDFTKCRADLLRIRERLDDSTHLFKEEMISHLLMAHILDLYDIHARSHTLKEPSERLHILLSRFIGLLYQKEYVRHRDLPYYASKLCITPHYLSEICRKASGQPASYWIDRFTLLEITRRLCRKNLTLAEIAEGMNFSSLSYFSRYVRKRTGLYPSEYRNRLLRSNEPRLKSSPPSPACR